MTATLSKPALSVVIVIYNMEREARRSLHALSAAYQQGVASDDYEVVVVDNGSAEPFNGGSVAQFGPNFHYHYVADTHAAPANRSPVRAMKIGLSIARSDYVALIVDGARILTPGVLRYGLMLPRMFANPCGLTLGWHLGPDLQSRSIQHGYNQTVEDELLERIAWPTEGYRLFEIGSTHDPGDGWFRLVGESTCTFMHRALLEEVGGYDERYVTRGGGLANLDIQTQIYELPHVELVMLLGEGTFHQFHNGATSGTAWPEMPAIFEGFVAEYRAIRGGPFIPVTGRRPSHVGHMPPEALGFLHKFIEVASPAALGMDRDLKWLIKEVEGRDVVIRHRDEAIEWLKGEVVVRDKKIAELQAELERCPSAPPDDASRRRS